MAELNGARCVPSALQGRLTTYRCNWDANLRALVDAETRAELSFNFDVDYDEPLLVHHQAGGGAREALSLLQRIRFREDLASICREKLRSLGSDYDAIHIRNSDYRTDWKPFLAEVRSKLEAASVLICSDDLNVLRFCEGFFKPKQVLISSYPPDTGGKALHTHESNLSATQRDAVVRDCLVDLLALSQGVTLHYSNTTNGHPSGFSQLAELLHDRPDVIEALLAGKSE